MFLLESSTLTSLDDKTNALVTSGESRLGRVSLGGGQITIEGIHVTASITNDGTPAYKVAVSIASASIGGVPVTIDQDGVHLAGQGQGLPYQQASDALNGALTQAGVQLFLVGPEVTTSSNACDQTGTDGGTGTDTTTTTTSTDQSGTTPTTSSCDQPSSCDQTGTATGTTTTSTTTTTGVALTPTTTTTTTDQTGTTNSCDQTGMTTPTSSCDQAGATTPTTSSSNQASTTTETTTTGSTDPTGTAPGTTSAGEETVTATGLHVVFTQPVEQSGVPAQNAEHILGEVFLDSLAVPAGPLPVLDLNFNSSFNSSSSSSSSCSGGSGGSAGGTKTSGGAAAGGSLSAGGSSSPTSFSPSASGFTSGSQPGSSAAGSPLGASLAGLASIVRSKPLWVLLAYLLWQTVAVATGASLWHWRRGGAA